MPEYLGDFDISFSAILSSLLFSAIGLWLYRKGRKENEIPLVLNGLALMLYSYFTHGPILDWGIGAVLCGLAYHLTH